ncbi:YbaN family protein [Roseibium sp.]|uniref:YbaN family protein n=1 Tax=Roseibium sp. TaxID=1936156 RepID=UPI003A97CEB0
MRRTTYKLLGVILVIVGLIGAVLPLLPTTIFFILAAGCFARSSPALEARILEHPRIGPSVIAWREHGVIPPRAKMIATTSMIAGYLLFLFASRPDALISIAAAAVIGACAVYVLTRPSYPRTPINNDLKNDV